MLSKFALALKTKTVEFFAEEDEDDDDNASTVDLSSTPEEVITGQRVVVLKPDPLPSRPSPDAVASSVLAAISSFRSAYLQLQAAHSPFDPSAASAADRAAVYHLQRISDLKREFINPSHKPTPTPNPNSNPNFFEAQVQENQSLLRTFETVFNRLQAEIDSKDAKAAELKQRIREAEAANSKLARKFKSKSLPSIEKVESFLSVGVFDSLLKDCRRTMHQFSKVVIGLMNKSRLDFDSVVDSIYPNVEYVKPGHWRYAILSYVCLSIFDGFDSVTFCCGKGEIESDSIDESTWRRNSLSQFVEHLSVDQLEMLRRNPDCEFAQFCESKYQKLVSKCMESSIFGNLDQKESVFCSLKPSSPLYQSFVDMASSIWLLHKLARAFDPVVEIFQVARGKEFSMVFMESVVKSADDYGKIFNAKVGFTVVPGFRVGKTMIQCRVYLEGVKEEAT